MRRLPPRSTHFPYTTLFRSGLHVGDEALGRDPRERGCHLGLARECAGASLLREQVERQRGVPAGGEAAGDRADRKSTRLNSSHANSSYAVLCLKTINPVSVT